jgi:anti-sigma regulatory factor (Ser/Thr protein kinase)
VADWLHKVGADALVEPAMLLVSELATNAVIHVGRPYLVTGHWEPPLFRVEVLDPSPALPARMRRPNDRDQPGGRGLTIVDEIAHAWGVVASNDHKVVWFDLDHGSA